MKLFVSFVIAANLMCGLCALQEDESKPTPKSKHRLIGFFKRAKIDEFEDILQQYEITQGPDKDGNIHYGKNDYVVIKINPTSSSDEDNEEEEINPGLDNWSVVWYIASFGGLIAFFLVVSCSEWCCRRNARRACQRNVSASSPQVPDTPPPSYDLFAPPSYDSLCKSNGEKSKYDVYVVPVEVLSNIMEAQSIEDDEPPSYGTASALVPHYTIQSLPNGSSSSSSSLELSNIVVSISTGENSNGHNMVT